MTEKKRPDTRIVLKPTEGGPTITVASFWTDGDRPSGGLDRRIVKLKLQLEDGTIVTVDNAHGQRSHWCNLYTDAHGAGPAKAPTAAAKGDWSASYPKREAPASDTDGDDIPF